MSQAKSSPAASESLPTIAAELSAELERLRFGPPVAYVYNPLTYAWNLHQQYLDRYGRGRREVLLVGMNPGPWGMAQTGVPFGAVPVVRDWLGLSGDVAKPVREFPARPVLGLACQREEVSGMRLWGWARDHFGSPAEFFARFFVGNYCPLLFLDAAGRNLTPDKLKVADRQALLGPCDRALRRTALALGVRHVVGVGEFAARQAERALTGLGLAIGGILHPSPANPSANRGWAAAAVDQLRALDIDL